MSGRKGSSKERELRRAFEAAGWFAIRSPGSSGGYDVIAGKNGHLLVMELKYISAGETVYFEDGELYGDSREDGGVEGVAKDLGGHAYAVVRWKRDTTFYALPVRLLDKTDGGNPKITPDDKDRAIELPPPVEHIADKLPDEPTPDTPDAPDTSTNGSDEQPASEVDPNNPDVAVGRIEVRITEDTTD